LDRNGWIILETKSFFGEVIQDNKTFFVAFLENLKQLKVKILKYASHHT
jgi:hypothetical protein